MSNNVQGVCCTCQSIHPLRPSKTSREDVGHPMTDRDLDGEIVDWVMDTHDAWGEPCEGSGTQPQAVVN